MDERGDQRVQVTGALPGTRQHQPRFATAWNFELKTPPRRPVPPPDVIQTEYDLPRETNSPQDVIADGDGMAGYTSLRIAASAGHLKTGEVDRVSD